MTREVRWVVEKLALGGRAVDQRADGGLGWGGSRVLLRGEMGEEGVALGGSEGGGFAGGGHLVVAAGGATGCGGFGVGLPLGFNELVAFEAAEGGVDGAGGKAGDVHDFEAEAVAEREGLEDKRGGVGEAGWGEHVDGAWLCSMLARVRGT